MILPSDTDVAVSLDACWISDIVQPKLGLESQGRIQSQVRKKAIFFSGAFSTFFSCSCLTNTPSLELRWLFFLITRADIVKE